MATRVICFGTFGFFLVVKRKDSVCYMETTTLSRIEQSLKQVTEGISTQMVDTVWKIMASGMDHIIRVNDGHINPDST